MPPPGGFATINVDRTLPRPLLRQGVWFAILAGLTINGYFYALEWKRRHLVLRTELTEHYIAASPFIYAEQERKFLKHLKNLRETERDLMKDHPNWKLGTLYGERLYKTLPKDALPPIGVQDFIAFNHVDDWILKRQVPDL